MSNNGPKPQRIQRRRAKGWRMPPNTVCVTRPGKWGNPFIVGEHGTRGKCVELFRLLLASYVCATTGPDPDAQIAYRKFVLDHIHELRGKNLACFCKVGAPCHADVLLEIANAQEAV